MNALPPKVPAASRRESPWELQPPQNVTALMAVFALKLAVLTPESVENTVANCQQCDLSPLTPPPPPPHTNTHTRARDRHARTHAYAQHDYDVRAACCSHPPGTRPCLWRAMSEPPAANIVHASDSATEMTVSPRLETSLVAPPHVFGSVNLALCSLTNDACVCVRRKALTTRL